jgi:hypothetical protein
LNNVQKLEDGEKFGGSTSAASDFAVWRTSSWSLVSSFQARTMVFLAF